MVERLRVFAAVEIIHGHAFQNADRQLPGFICGPVVNLQAGAATTNINATLAQHDFVLAINSLMTVTHNEQVIGA